MKRKFAFILAVMICLFSLVSCAGKDSPHLDSSAFGEDFRADNPELFISTSCEHLEKYKSAGAVSPDMDSSVYHYVYCHWGSCDYLPHYEPHKIKLSEIASNDYPELKENLYYYHAIYVSCPDCGQKFYLYVLCEKQDRSCIPNETGCLKNADWREILCDTPYEISDD